ncbi:ABC transporter ATP-binding protein [Leekyejoonella antrihumi]|uniref:ABC transporter ATP-binding protein n=1 Tax=Leekyejoonella antrihumi TaxID=1660198 RepID=A0A563DYE5_9MICO|nr:ABC transporter ATP-binding protein [Leekyejoonella antrihumi]TWP35288.1 ABC transporter ATP-binding protein [Leekyejoonella antrihumi]
MPPSAAAEPGGASDGSGSRPAIETRSLTKRFGEVAAVDDLSLRVPRGSVYGFLGPNGSGKTTTIRMLLGLVHPTAGDHDILGYPMPARQRDALPRVGSLVEGPAFHPYLSGTANLQRLDAADAHASAATSAARIRSALERVGLGAAAGKRYRAYSLGMKQRLAIAAALLAPRDLLILDEPTNGLDPQGTREVRHLVSALVNDGMTILISSHLLSEIEQICSHIGVMRAGRLVAQGPIHEVQSTQQATVVVRTPDPGRCAQLLREGGLGAVQVTGDVVTGVPSAATLALPEDLVARLVAGQVRVRGFQVETPSLEDFYVSLTGEGFDVRA